MQRFKTLALALGLGMCATAAHADLIITQKSGKSTALDLEAVRKITFANGNMLISGDAETTFAISDVQKLHFGKLTALRNLQSATPALAYANGMLTISGKAGSTLSLYGIDGKLLLQQSIGAAQENLDLNHLSQGIFVVRVGGETLKFVR